MARFSPLAVAVLAALGSANGFVIKSTMSGLKPLQMVRGMECLMVTKLRFGGKYLLQPSLFLHQFFV